MQILKPLMILAVVLFSTKHTQASQAKLTKNILHNIRRLSSFMQQRLAYEVHFKKIKSQDCSCCSDSTQETLATLKPKRILTL